MPPTNAPSTSNLQFGEVVQFLFLAPKIRTALQGFVDVGDDFAIARIARRILIEANVEADQGLFVEPAVPSAEWKEELIVKIRE
jgi:hypothetical protein